MAEVRGQRPDVRMRVIAGGDPKSEVGIQKTKIRSQRVGLRGRIIENSDQTSEDREFLNLEEGIKGY